MIDKLKGMLADIDAEYADLRYETVKETKIGYSGEELTEVSSSRTDGYVVRVLADGGMSSIAFTKPGDAREAAATALSNAKLLAARQDQPIELAPVPPTVDTIKPELDEDPNEVSTAEKLRLLREYNQIPLSREKVATTDLRYLDISRHKQFVSTEGAEVQEDLVTVRVSGAIVTQDGNLTQTIRVGMGGSDGMGRVRNRHDYVEQRTKIALDLLNAEPVEGGTYSVVIDPQLAGVFTHEAFGHFSEADLIEDAPTMRERMQIGADLGTDVLSITDDPTRPNQLGHYTYDDEGVAARPTALMKNGVLMGRLHSRRTAAAFDEPVSGHSIAQDYRYPPIIRMGSIYIEPRDASFEELMSELGDGLYLLNPMGGQTSGENFTFGAQYGYVVRNGRKAGMVRDINLSGDLYSTLKSIRAVGNDLKLSETGGCGKGQLNLRSCYGGPHVLVEGVVIGGR